MAKITFSGIGVTEARGAYANQVYSRNKGGNYYRARVTPFYPNSDNQQIFTGEMTTLTALWQGLDPAIQREWITAAQSTRRLNVLGKDYILSGFNLFVSQCFNILLAGGIPSLLPAGKAFVRAPLSITVNALSNAVFNVSLTVAGAAVTMPNNVGLILYGSGSVSAGITSKTSGFAGFFGVFPTDPLANIDVFNEYFQIWGTPVPGSKIFLRARVYHQLSGQSSQYLYTSAVVS